MYEAIFMHHVWGCYAIQVSWLFLQCWNRLRFSPLNTWWSSWLAFQGHVVQKKCKLKHLNHTRIVRCSYYESNSGTETKERNMRFPSPFSHSPGAYALAGRGTDAPTLLHSSFLFLPGTVSGTEYGCELYMCWGDVAFPSIMFLQKGSTSEWELRASASMFVVAGTTFD